MMKKAIRIKDRAIRRAGELLKLIEPANGKRTDMEPAVVDHGRLSRGEVAKRAGMSEHQQTQAIRVANVPQALPRPLAHDGASRRHPEGPERRWRLAGRFPGAGERP
jgi:hypothetical protein